MRLPNFKIPGKYWWTGLRQKGWRFVIAESQVSFFPVLLVAVLAAMSYWLAIVSNPPEEDISGRFRHDPDVIVKNFQIRTFNPIGLKKDTLTGQLAEHYPDDESTMMKNPSLKRIASPSVPATTIKADLAYLNSDQSEIELMTDVVAFRPAYNGREAVTFKTSQIMVYTDEERAETKRRVTVYQGRDWIAGTGFDMDNVTQVYKFHSRVEGVHYPGTKTPRSF